MPVHIYSRRNILVLLAISSLVVFIWYHTQLAESRIPTPKKPIGDSLIVLYTLPKYYQILLYVLVGLWCFTLVMNALEWLGIDVTVLFSTTIHFQLPSPQLQQQQSSLSGTLYVIAIAYSAITFASIYLFQHNDSKWIPLLTYTLLVGHAFWPILSKTPILSKLLLSKFSAYQGYSLLGTGSSATASQRAASSTTTSSAFTSSLFRSFHPSSPVHFIDIILMDILTSYSRILSDSVFILCDLLGKDRCYSSVVGPMITCIPFAIRLKQCLIEWNRDKHTQAQGKRHLLNAIKYSTSFPVIISGGVVGYMTSSHTDTSITTLVTIWTIASTINTLYSLYWDLKVDWMLFHPRRRTYDHYIPPFLRPTLMLPVWIYYIAMLLNTILRFSWITKLSPSFRLIDFSMMRDVDGDGVLEDIIVLDAVLKVLEVIRRMMWCLIRVEREWVVTKGGMVTNLTRMEFATPREDIENDGIGGMGVGLGTEMVGVTKTGASLSLNTPPGRLPISLVVSKNSPSRSPQGNSGRTSSRGVPDVRFKSDID